MMGQTESTLMLSRIWKKARSTKVNSKALLTCLTHVSRKKCNKQRDGLGVQLWPDGSKYEGMWKDDRCHGKGRMTHANGDVYQGEWKNDMANGHGTFVDTQGAKYTGEWLNDL